MAGLSQDFLLKDVFNERVVRAFAGRIKDAHQDFELENFVADTVAPFDALGFIERSNHLRDMLYQYLPKDYPSAVNILLSAMEPELVAGGDTAWDSFPIMSQCAFVSKYGAEKKHFDLSMKALYEMTKRFSAEWDLRTFIEVDYERAISYLEKWCSDSSEHVRRLVSEGTRPRLPLSGRIPRFQKDPAPVIKLLDRMVGDESPYVRRSVANNINDIAKDNPDIAVSTLKRWNENPSKDIQWVVKHAARSLIKQGHPEALEIFGIRTNVNIEPANFKLDRNQYRLNDSVYLSFEIKSNETKPQKLIVDYVMHYIKANGNPREKIFKMRELTIKPGEKVAIFKKHLLRNTSGRTHYPGYHEVELQINGKRFGKAGFMLKV